MIGGQTDRIATPKTALALLRRAVKGILMVRLCMGGLIVLGAGTLRVSFFRIVKIMRFYEFAGTSIS